MNSSPELPLIHHKRICVNCNLREVYLDTELMDFCEECIYALALLEDTSEIEHQRSLDKSRQSNVINP